MQDCIILGGGVIGLACALKLARADLDIVLFDKDPTPAAATQINARVSALSITSIELLQQLEVWDKIPKQYYCYYDQMHILDQAQATSLHFKAQDVGRRELGAIVDNAALRFALYAELKQYSNVELIFSGAASRIEADAAQVKLFTATGVKTAAVLIGADGAQSWVREQAHIDCNTTLYDHHALVTTVLTEKPHANTAWQSFLTTGPLAFLPLADPHNCAIVWSTNPTEAERLKALPEAEFCKTLAEAFSLQLGAINSATNRVVIPLIKRHATSYASKRIALCGDACHSIHPMAGQGMNLGFADVVVLTELIIAANKLKRDIGAAALLNNYQRRRYWHNQLMLSSMDVFDNIFTTPNAHLQQLRKLGLGVVNQSTLLQRLFVAGAAGSLC